jgi:hypothetical protein
MAEPKAGWLSVRPPGSRLKIKRYIRDLAILILEELTSRDDQCVTPSRSGSGSRVASTMATSSVTRGLPGLDRSASPPIPSAAE